MSLFKKKEPKDEPRCPYCSGLILRVPATDVANLTPNREALICENYYNLPDGTKVDQTEIDNHLIERKCDAYCLCHAPSSKFGNEGKPMGRLADQSLRQIHMEANKAFADLWMTRLINHVWSFVVGYHTDNGIVYAKRLTSKGDPVTIELIDTGMVVKVPADDIETVSARTKAYVWLAQQMGAHSKGFSIQSLDEDESIKAINIIKQTIRNYARND